MIENKSESPLVSICVIAYHSSRTVVETLNSAFSQTYPRLELIVSDDCSSDDTVDICRQWIDAHKDRFERTEVIVREKNGGVAANFNTAIRACQGEWIKTIAGDDLLLPDCIKDNISFVRQNENQGIVFSRVSFFSENNGNRAVLDYSWPDKDAVKYYSMSAEEQYRRILVTCFTPSTSVFMEKKLAMRFPFPEQYPFNEDDPLWLRMTKEGIKLSYFDKTTVLYRAGVSLSHADDSSFVSTKYHFSKLAYFYTDRYFALKSLAPQAASRLQKEFFLGDVAVILLKNRKNLLSRAVLFLFKMLLGTRTVQ